MTELVNQWAKPLKDENRAKIEPKVKEKHPELSGDELESKILWYCRSKFEDIDW